jgi:hypothetical protein
MFCPHICEGHHASSMKNNKDKKAFSQNNKNITLMD